MNQKLVQLGDRIINKKLRNEIPRPDCTLIVGQKRTGKSTLFVPIARYYNSLGYKVFCNFPVKNCFAIPMVKVYDKKSDDYFDCIDKKWLYHTNLKKCVVLIDEASPYWGARDYSSWSLRDQKWFTELGKNEIIVFLITQYYDLIDLNIKRSCDEELFLTRSRWFRNITYIEASELISAKQKDLTRKIVDLKGIKEAYPVDYAVCAIPLANFKMYRTPYYDDFDTHFSFTEFDEIKANDIFNWNDHVYFKGSFSDCNGSDKFLCKCFDEFYFSS